MKRLDGYENLLLFLPAASVGVGWLCFLRIEPVIPWFALFLALTAGQTYFALCCCRAKPITRLILGGLLPLTALLWTMAKPSKAELEMHSVRPGMTYAEVRRALPNWKPYNLGGNPMLPPGSGFWHPRHGPCAVDYISLTFDRDGRLNDLHPTYD